MTKWKASLPRELPAEGEALYVIALKSSNGDRLEMSGKLPFDVAYQISRMAQHGTLDGEPAAPVIMHAAQDQSGISRFRVTGYIKKKFAAHW